MLTVLTVESLPSGTSIPSREPRLPAGPGDRSGRRRPRGDHKPPIRCRGPEGKDRTVRTVSHDLSGRQAACPARTCGLTVGRARPSADRQPTVSRAGIGPIRRRGAAEVTASRPVVTSLEWPGTAGEGPDRGHQGPRRPGEAGHARARAVEHAGCHLPRGLDPGRCQRDHDDGGRRELPHRTGRPAPGRRRRPVADNWWAPPCCRSTTADWRRSRDR
jgi:hypothetical protein